MEQETIGFIGLELLNDIRKFSYGENRKKLDQAVNMFAMLEMLMTINE